MKKAITFYSQTNISERLNGEFLKGQSWGIWRGQSGHLRKTRGWWICEPWEPTLSRILVSSCNFNDLCLRGISEHFLYICPVVRDGDQWLFSCREGSISVSQLRSRCYSRYVFSICFCNFGTMSCQLILPGGLRNKISGYRWAEEAVQLQRMHKQKLHLWSKFLLKLVAGRESIQYCAPDSSLKCLPAIFSPLEQVWWTCINNCLCWLLGRRIVSGECEGNQAIQPLLAHRECHGSSLAWRALTWLVDWMPQEYLFLLQGRKGDNSAAMSMAGLCVATIYDAFAEAAYHNMLPRGFVCLAAGLILLTCSPQEHLFHEIPVSFYKHWPKKGAKDFFEEKENMVTPVPHSISTVNLCFGYSIGTSS